MMCTCGAASVGGGHANYCDSLIELPKLETPTTDPINFSSQPISHNWNLVFPNKTYALRLPTTQHTIEDALLSKIHMFVTLDEHEMNDLKNKYMNSVYPGNNGKDVVSFVSQVFEEI